MSEIDPLALPAGYDAASGGGHGYQFFKMKKADDVQLFRILPSMKGLLKKRDYAVFAKQHYGLVGRNPSDPSKPAYRPFLCIEEKRQGMTIKECPMCQLRAEYQAKFNALKAEETQAMDKARTAAKAQGMADAQIAAGLAKISEKYKALKEPLFNWLKTHGTDSKYRLYVINKAGQLGIFQIPYNMKKKLDRSIKEIEAREYPKRIAGDRKVAIKANGRVGVFFKFLRNGPASPDSDDAILNTVEFGDDGAMVPDFHTVTDDVLEQAKEVLPCLLEQIEELRLSDEKVATLVQHVRDCGGSCDPEFVDSVMGKRGSNKAAPAKSEAADDPFADGVPTGIDTKTEPVTAAETPKAKAEVKAEVKPEIKPEPVKVAPEAAKPAETQPVADTAETSSSSAFDDIFG